MNIYETTYTCVERLYQEYLKHKNLIVACDFDDCVFPYKVEGNNFDGIFEVLKQAQDQGHIIVMYSACKKERFPFIINYMKEKGINVAAINTNPFPMEYGNDGKIFYNILLDDKAGLGQAVIILKATLAKIREATL